ncbi:MFS transporter [Noviherbaspirillum autotrophicum]|uniref:MFS transporter n=1 Tax=Noviherbaspirillum autotrophicum TaxID=709839 RepID=A0A0C1YHS0_9BURK|nr:MFS transporter [Noviherbaspirillum autotrophicum]KIF80042.1 MFS transporter [Noviherbaspirillum autotrophicum]
MPKINNAKSARIPRTVWVLGFVSMLMDVSSEIIHSLLPVFMTVALGASATTVGIIEGIAEATALIVKVFSGVMSDYVGKRKSLTLIGYGMGALSKPLFALASGTGWVLSARFIDRIGKGMRGAPRDALIADVTDPAVRGAAFGLRQSLDTVGAFVGPLLAVGLMLLWADDFRAVFWVAVIPGLLAVALLALGVREPERKRSLEKPAFPISRRALGLLPRTYWWVVGAGALLTLARFSEAFLVLRAQQGGLSIALVPLVMVLMNIVYALGAYPFGILADKIRHKTLLMLGIAPLIVADLLLAYDRSLGWIAAGVIFWGVHMAATQGLLAAMVADTAPAELRGTAFGLFNLASGMAMLVASVVAGLLWDRFGAATTFQAGAAFAAAALVLLLFRGAADQTAAH